MQHTHQQCSVAHKQAAMATSVIRVFCEVVATQNAAVHSLQLIANSMPHTRYRCHSTLLCAIQGPALAVQSLPKDSMRRETFYRLCKDQLFWGRMSCRVTTYQCCTSASVKCCVTLNCCR